MKNLKNLDWESFEENSFPSKEKIKKKNKKVEDPNSAQKKEEGNKTKK